VKPDQKIIDSLMKNGTVAIDEKVMDGEHSMGGIVPFIKYYLPDAQVVPLIVSGKLNKEEIERLVGILDTYISDKTVLVASVDFSHYQTQAKAEQNDETTLQLMKERDLDQILTLSSAYIDSPPSIAVLLSLMMRRNIEKFELVYHTNAGQILGNPHKEVTSYFSFVF
jgi:AmmeMemoRadiSam system protein B